MNTVLYGNGFNRLNDVDSWESLVHVIDDNSDRIASGFKNSSN